MKQKTILTLGTLLFVSASSLFAQENNVANEGIVISEAEKVNEVIIKLPKVPEVPKVEAIVPTVITVDSNGNPISTQTLEDLYPRKKAHVFSSHVAPEKYQQKKKTKAKDIQAGDVNNGRVAAYLHAALVSVDDVKTSLTKAGFKILATFIYDSNL